MTDHNARQAELTMENAVADAEAARLLAQEYSDNPDVRADVINGFCAGASHVRFLAAHSADARNGEGVALTDARLEIILDGLEDQGFDTLRRADKEDLMAFAELFAAPAAPAPKGEVVVTRNTAGAIVAVTRQDEEGRILSVIAEAAPAPAAQADGWQVAFNRLCEANHLTDEEEHQIAHTFFQAGLRQQSATPAVPAIKAMVDRFLGWKLPRDFSPDCGISFTPPANPEWGPSGTNLLNADQARQMFEYVCSTPAPASQAEIWLNITPSNGEVAAFSLAPIKGLDWHRYVRQQSATPAPAAQADQWISVKDRLPEDGQNVLFRFDWNDRWQYGAGSYEDGFYCDAGDMGIGPNEGVSDWMPIERQSATPAEPAHAGESNASTGQPIYQIETHCGHWLDTTKRHYRSRESGKFSGGYRIVYATPADAASEAGKRDAERWRTFERALRTGHLRGAAYGRRFKIIETCPVTGDEKEFNAFVEAIDAAVLRERQQGADRG